MYKTNDKNSWLLMHISPKVKSAVLFKGVLFQKFQEIFLVLTNADVGQTNLQINRGKKIT